MIHKYIFDGLQAYIKMFPRRLNVNT